MLFEIVTSFVLTVFSVLLPIITQCLLEKFKYPKIDPTAITIQTSSNTLIALHYLVVWIIACVIMMKVQFNWITSSYDVLRVPTVILIIDFFGYVYHYVFHTKLLYMHFHYRHHLIRNPGSFRDNTYTNIIDWTVSVLTYMAPFAFVDVTIPVLLVYMLVTIQIQVNHSGLKTPKIPGIISSTEHYIHHIKPKYNFCELTTTFDRLFCTYLSESEFNKLRP